jgi:hypothetical protein
VLARARSIAAIAEWAGDAEATIRRKRARLDADADALAGATGAWLADRERRGPAVSRRRAVAVDGKTLRGARGAGADGRPVHLLAAMDHQSRTVLAQRQVGGAPVYPAPAGAPGGHRRRAADPPRRRRVPSRHQARPLPVCVKANQPTLLDRCQRLPWRLVPIAERARDRSTAAWRCGPSWS